jgi:glycosyltransferase involved in cell wall biosynthesis
MCSKTLSISVIMPVYNGVDFIKESLPPLIDMQKRGEVLEVIVVDDTSTDKTPILAAEMGARVLPSGGRLGPGAARNVAAREAKGDLLWFIDADVIVHDNAAVTMQAGFDSDEVVGVFGSYDDAPPAQNFLSQYKNLVHHFYHQKALENASTFWSGCGAIRKDKFLAVNGFDVEKFKHPSVEDIELGYRLIAAGGRIRLLIDLQCTHLKEWRFVNLVHTEVFRRAIPWSRLMLAGDGLMNDLNVGFGERIRAVVAGLFCLCGLLLLGGYLSLSIFFLITFVVLLINKEIVQLFLRRKGLFFALGGFLFHQFYYIYSSLAFAWVVLERQFDKLVST